jgi:ubiquinone/menaquinone biosynthesis C-methylase UbiE
VHLAGFLPPTEVVPAVRDADAAVILYYARSADYQAALPNKLFQSIAAELPVLYPDLPQIASVMRAAGAGLCIDAQNPSSIVRAVERLMQDRDAAGTAAVRRRLRDQWAWETEERLFAEQVRRCLREARPLPAARASRRRGQREPMTTAERGMTVDDVRRFWEGHPVAAAAIPAERGTAQYFAAYDRLREANESLEFSHALHEYRQFKGQTVLDVGCGNGYVLGKYAAEGARAFGVDLTGAGIALCRRRFALQGLSGQFTVGNAEALPFPDEFFDCACSMGVLHHTPAPQAAVDELYRVLKPGGRLIIMMYHRNSATYRLQMFANRLRTGRAMDELVRSIDGAGNPIGDVYSKAELRRLLGRFADVECFAGCLQREMLPKLGRVIPESWLRRLGRRWGWFLYAKARKPRRQGL